MKKLTIIALGLLTFTMQGCDFLDRDAEDIIESGKFFENAQANALEQYCNDFYPKLFYGHGAPNGYNSMLDTTLLRTMLRVRTGRGATSVPATSS